jgi:ADP-heptose:LPS heptosyltransferase
MIRQLRQLHTSARIDVLCQSSNRPLLQGNPHVDHLCELPRGASAFQFLRLARRLRKRHYDMVVDTQALPKTALFTRLTGAPRRLGYRRGWMRNRSCYSHPVRACPTDYVALQHLHLLQDARVCLQDLALELQLSPGDLEAGRRFRASWFRPPVAAVFGVDRYGYRCWPVEKTAQLADRLAASGFQPFLVYGPGQLEHARLIAAAMSRQALVEYPMPSFPMLAAILTGCDLFVGSDGGPKHLALAMRVPTVTIYHGALAANWNPPNNENARVVASRCEPTSQSSAGRFLDVDRLTEIPVDAVWDEVQSLVDANSLGCKRGPLGSPRPTREDCEARK